MIVTAKIIEIAKDIYNSELGVPEIGKKHGFSDRHIYRLTKKPEISKIIEGFGKADTEKAQRILKRASVKAAHALVEIVDGRADYSPEVVRRAASDILGAVHKDKGEEKGDKTTVIQIINTIPGMFADGNSGDASKKNSTAGRGFRVD